MKKAIGIIILSLLWCNMGFAENYTVIVKNKVDKSIFIKRVKPNKQEAIDAALKGCRLWFEPQGKKMQVACYVDTLNGKKYVRKEEAELIEILKKSSLPECEKGTSAKRNNCVGTIYDPKNKTLYVGEFKKGKSDGHGMFKSLDIEYIGEFNNGHFSGQGTFTIISGDRTGVKYVGEFKNSKRHGQGSLYVPEKESGVGENSAFEIVGEWKNDYAINVNWTHVTSGDTFIGGLDKNFCPHGKGTYTLSNGDKVVAMFKNCVAHGKGILYMIDGEVAKGTYKDGVMYKGIITELDGTVKIIKNGEIVE